MTDRDKEIIRLYLEERKTGVEIAKLYNRSCFFVYNILRKHSVKRRSLQETHRKYFVDTSYFSNINTQEKAYILGFLYADGYNSNKGIVINLHEQDKEILEKIKTELGYEGSVVFRKKDNASNQYSLQIKSQEISQDLTKLGCVNKKSLILKFPTEEQVPSNLVKHFIRGYFDGDGSLFFNESYCINITSTQEFLIGVQQVLQSSAQLETAKLNQCNSGKNTYKLRIKGNNKTLSFLNWLYKDASIFLNRKHTKYQEFISYYSKILDKKESRNNRVCLNPDCSITKIYGNGLCSKCYQKKCYKNKSPHEP